MFHHPSWFGKVTSTVVHSSFRCREYADWGHTKLLVLFFASFGFYEGKGHGVCKTRIPLVSNITLGASRLHHHA